jgi:phosphate transport system protein
MMREAYHEQLDLLIDDLARMTLLVEDVMAHATSALLAADAQAARRAVRGEAEFAPSVRDIDERVFILAAREQPVAGDLRTLVGALRITADLRRMSHLAGLVADLVVERQPHPVIPPELAQIVTQMGQLARTATAEVAKALVTRDWQAAARLDREDDAMDRLQRSFYTRVLDGSWPHPIEVAIDAALIGRYFERYADHATAMAHHVAFMAGHEPLDPPFARAAQA